MRILEVRDGFIKFEADETIYLSSFVRIDGIDKTYIAQVIQLKRSGNNSIGYAKILFLYDGSLLNYDKTLPSKDSTLEEFTYEILNNSIKADKPVIIGKTQNTDINIAIDISAFDKKMIVSVDDKIANNTIIQNLVKQFNNLDKNVVIIDTLGTIDAKKVVAGVDFKLPLNTESLAFMYQECLNDATADSKSLIIEIFKDLAEYSKTVPFVPFETLKSIVDDMVDKSHVFKLLVLKNKLAKFEKLGYFATKKSEVEKLKHYLNSKCVVIDISKLDNAFLNRYLSFIYETINDDAQVILELSNAVSKKNIKDALKNDVATTFITHSRFKYLNDIKNVFDNFVIMPSLANNEIFSIYATFLKSMPKNTYLVVGEATNYIPLVSPLTQINDVIDIAPSLIETKDVESDNELENIVSNNTENSVSEISQDDILENVPTEIEMEFPQEAEPEVNVELEDTDNKISNEEILANIEEKSNDIIAKATEELVAPITESMFEDSDSEINIQEDIAEESDNINEEISSNDIEITEDDLESREDNTLEETFDGNQLENQEVEQNVEQEGILEEIPLSETFTTEVHDSEETDTVIQDYVPEYNNNEVEEISLDDELEEFSNDNSVDNSEVVYKAEDLEEANNIQDNGEQEETEIELDNDINLELDEQFEDEQQNIEPYATNDEELNQGLVLDNDNIEELNADDFEEITELNPDDVDDNDIIVDLEEEKELDENVDEQIVKDVDKVFTTRKDDDISDSDLDFIDELNNDGDDILEEVQDDSVLEELSENEEDGILEEIPDAQPIINTKEDEEQEILETRNSSTPIVPVYEADIPQEDIVMSDPIQQGDTVTHAKYGVGVVEKMIKYGNKTLFSINFDNIGRRLLDPTLTEIKKA